jgi:signal transduction histidine kinase
VKLPDRDRLRALGDRPLDPLPSLKMKVAVALFASVSITVFVFWVGVRLLHLWPSVSGIVAMIVALVCVRVLVRGLTTPLREMAEAARAMARGEYGRQVRITDASRDEVAELARAFNAMASELAVVDRMRRDLVANVSHELRTPISALQAVLENIVDGVEPPDPETLRTMLRQVERLGRLVTQLLDLSKLESGAVPLNRRPFDLVQLLEDAADETRLHAPDVPVVVVAAAPSLATDGDPERIHQVVANLLENAVRFTPAGAQVELRARRDNGTAIVEVCDHGPGIPADDADRVFERFYRADPSRASTRGGAGLGLAIARWIVDLHGGRIRPEPNEPTGCRMVVELPSPGRSAPAATPTSTAPTRSGP